MKAKPISEPDCITSFASTVCRLMGVSPPALADGEVLEAVIEAAQRQLKGIHFENIPEDMEVTHFFGFRQAERS